GLVDGTTSRSLTCSCGTTSTRVAARVWFVLRFSRETFTSSSWTFLLVQPTSAPATSITESNRPIGRRIVRVNPPSSTGGDHAKGISLSFERAGDFKLGERLDDLQQHHRICNPRTCGAGFALQRKQHAAGSARPRDRSAARVPR